MQEVSLPRVEGTGRDPTSLRLQRLLLWLAVIAPFIYSATKTSAQVTGGEAIGPLELLRGVGPAVLWFIASSLNRTRRKGRGAPEYLLAAYAAVTVFSTFNIGNPSPQSTLLKAGSLCFVLLSLGRLARAYDTAEQAMRALAGFVHVILLATAFQYVVFRSDVYTIGPGEYNDVPRLSSVVPQVSPNPLALLALAGILSCVLGVLPRWIPSGGFVRLALTGLYMYEIYLTRTRSALATGLVVILVALILRARRRPLSTLAVFAVTLLFVMLALPQLWPEVHDYLQRGQTAQSLDTLTGRTVIWSDALAVWHAHPTLGLGYYAGHRLGIPGLSTTQSNVDNTWLETLVDVGVVGLVPLALFAIAGTVRLVRTRSLTSDTKLWAVGMTLYGLVLSFFNPTYQTPLASQVVLTFMLLAAVPVRTPSESSDTPSARDLSRPVGGHVDEPSGAFVTSP